MTIDDLDALVRLLSMPHNATDLRTLANLQAQRVRIVEAACAIVEAPASSTVSFGSLQCAVHEWRRITAPEPGGRSA